MRSAESAPRVRWRRRCSLSASGSPSRCRSMTRVDLAVAAATDHALDLIAPGDPLPGGEELLRGAIDSAPSVRVTTCVSSPVVSEGSGLATWVRG